MAGEKKRAKRKRESWQLINEFMRKNINYTRPLSEVDKIKICFSKEKGEITKFVIQYFGKFDRRWKTILRIDTCHNFPHMHTYHLQKREIKVKLGKNSDINQIFTKYKAYIIKNFQKIRENFTFSR